MSSKPIMPGFKPADIWDRYLFPIGLPLLIGMGLAFLLAVFTTNEQWLFALPLIVLLPVAILVIKDPFVGLMIWIAVLPWFPFDGTFKYVYFAVHRLLLPATLGLIILSRMFGLGKHRPMKPGIADLATLAFGAMGFISIYSHGKDWTVGLLFQDQFLVPFVAYWIIRLLDAQEKQIKRLMPIIFGITLLECAIGLVSWLLPSALPSIWYTKLVGDRVTGTFGQPVAYAYVLIFLVAFLFYDAMNRKNGPIRTAEMLVFGLAVPCLFFTFTRGAWVVGILSLLALVYLYPKPMALLIALFAAIMIILPDNTLAKEFAHADERLFNTQTAGSRLVLANAGTNMFLAKPIFGWGYHSYDRYDHRFMERVNEVSPTEWDIREGTSHNTFLTILAELGVVGMFLYTFPVVWWLILTVRAFPLLPKTGYMSQRLLLAMWLPVGAYIVSALDVDMRFFYYCLTLLWINLGLIANVVQSHLQTDSYWTLRQTNKGIGFSSDTG